MRVTLYAEGSRETGSPEGLPAPGDVLSEQHLGAGHILLRRSLQLVRPERDITFLSPLLVRSRRAQGSHLRSKKILRRLLAWPLPELRPDLAVVLIDGDGDGERLRTLRSSTENVRLPRTIVAVAVHEFEAWLVADHPAAQRTLGRALDPPKQPESMAPGDAKRLLSEWIAGTGKQQEAAARLELARDCDIQVLQSRCPSFALFFKELRGTLTLEDKEA